MNPSTQLRAGLDVEDRARTTVDPAEAAHDAELLALVRSAADSLPERDSDVLDLHLRHGLTAGEIGEDIGVAQVEASRMLDRTMGRLDEAVGARILFHRGRPRCALLRDLLGSDGAATFGPDAAALISAHVGVCADCAERRRTRLAPSALFAAIPVAVAPLAVKAHVAAALEAAGVPMSGSATMAAPGGAGAGQGAGGGGWYGTALTPRTPVPLQAAPVPPRPPVQPAAPTVEIMVAVSPDPAPPVAAAVASVAAIEAPPWRHETQVVDFSARRAGRRAGRRWTKPVLAAAASITLLTGAVAVAANRDRSAGDAVAAPEATTASVPDREFEVVVPDELPEPDPVEPDPGDDGPARQPSTTKPEPERAKDPDPRGGGDGGVGTGKDDAAGPTLVSFKLSDGSATSGTAVKSMPELTWEAKGPGSVKVSGAGVSSASMNGSETVCPGNLSGGRCWCEGTYKYTITLYDADGRVVKTATKTLTMEPAPEPDGSASKSGSDADADSGAAAD